MVKVSVLMPVYNTEESILKTTIQSILNQTYNNFELLILNDSPENKKLKEIILSFNDNRIKYFENETNCGISQSRNKLIDLANGEYLAIHDHDDISLPERFKKQVEYLDNNLDIGVISSNYICLSNNNISKHPEFNYDIKLNLHKGCCITHPASMIRKKILIENNIRYEEQFSPAEDYMLWVRLMEFTQFHNLQEVLLKYNDHENNTSHLAWNKMQDRDLIIKNILANKYPYLYKLNQCENKIFYLFGFIPILRISNNINRVRFYLFNKILILKIKVRV